MKITEIVSRNVKKHMLHLLEKCKKITEIFQLNLKKPMLKFLEPTMQYIFGTYSRFGDSQLTFPKIAMIQ